MVVFFCVWLCVRLIVCLYVCLFVSWRGYISCTKGLIFCPSATISTEESMAFVRFLRCLTFSFQPFLHRSERDDEHASAGLHELELGFRLGY